MRVFGLAEGSSSRTTFPEAVALHRSPPLGVFKPCRCRHLATPRKVTSSAVPVEVQVKKILDKEFQMTRTAQTVRQQ